MNNKIGAADTTASASGEREGWEAAAKALSERAAGHFRNKDYALQDECLQCASMLHDMKPGRVAHPVQAGEAVDALNSATRTESGALVLDYHAEMLIRASLAPVSAQQGAALEGFIPVPSGMNREELRRFIISHADTSAAAKAPAAQAQPSDWIEAKGRRSNRGGRYWHVKEKNDFSHDCIVDSFFTEDEAKQFCAAHPDHEYYKWVD